MKRRNFILGGGLLATLSLGATATGASLAESVTVSSVFNVIPDDPDDSADITLGDNTQFTETTHTWDDMNFISNDLAITEIEVEYGDAGNFADGGGFDSIGEGDVTIEFWANQQGQLRDPGFTYSNSDAATATFDVDETDDDAVIEDSGDEADTNVRIEFDGFENPESGSYEPTLTFVREDGEVVTIGDASFSTSTGAGDFLVQITDAPDEIGEGTQAEIKAEIENGGAGEDSQEITLEVDGEQEDSEGVNLDVNETTTVTLETEAVSGSEIEVVVSSEDDSDNRFIDVVGGWGLDLDPPTEDVDSIHTWETAGIDYDGEIDEITIDYIDGVQGPRLDMDRVDEFTIELTLDEDDDEPTNINFTATVPNNDQGQVTFDLDNDPTPEINGTSRIIIDDVRNPNDPGEYEAEISLTGDDRFSETITYTVEE